MNHVTKCAEALQEEFFVGVIKYDGDTEYYCSSPTEEIEAVIRPFFEEAESDAVKNFCKTSPLLKNVRDYPS